MASWSDQKTIEGKIEALETNLTNLETALAAFATEGGVLSATIDGKSVTKSEASQLEKLHKFFNRKLKALKAQKRIADGKTGQGFTQTRF